MPGFIIFDSGPSLGVLGRDLEVAADVVLHQFLHVLRRLHREVVAQARADQDLLDARQRARACGTCWISGVWSVLRFVADVRDTRSDGLRQADSISRDLHAMRYMLAVGPPRSEMTPVKPGDLVADRLDLADHRILASGSG